MAKKSEKRKLTHFHLLPVFIVAVALAFSLVFTIFLLPLTTITEKIDIKFLFTVLLVFSGVVSATVSLIFYLILSKRI